MSDHFLRLPPEERAEILDLGEQTLGRSAQLLEKDVWVCWTLEELFALEDGIRKAFKGGTSLSKVYSAIARFSEDVDVTFAHEDIAPDLDPFEANLSRNQQKRRPKRLSARMDAHLVDVIKPALDAALRAELLDDFTETLIEGPPGSTCLLIPYPSALGDSDAYLRPTVKLEPGCRNATTPCHEVWLAPNLCGPEMESELVFPGAEVTVLSGARTFWEKVTLAHAACANPARRIRTERTARHWYDLWALADHEIGREAIKALDLLTEVIHVKSIAYPITDGHYEDCASGALQLLPRGEHLEALRADYQGMIDARMFWSEPPSFEQITDRLWALQDEINQRCREVL